jgi:hypothetical protein
MLVAGTGSFGRVVLCEDSTVKDEKTAKYFAMKILRISDVLRLKQVEHIKDEKSILEVRGQRLESAHSQNPVLESAH